MFFGLDGLDTANKSGWHRAARQTTKEILVATQKFTGIDHAVDAALKGGNIKLVVLGIGNNDGRDNAGEFLSCHKNLLSCLASGPMPLTLVGSVQAV